MRVEWDEDKALRNLRKHAVDFVDAAMVFNDRYRIEEFDADHSDCEERWFTIGLVHADVLYVVYTERDTDLVRIISARRANRHEQRAYYSSRGH